MQYGEFGASGLSYKTARDLSGSFQRVGRYGKAGASSANCTATLGSQSAIMAIKQSATSRPGLSLINELAAAAQRLAAVDGLFDFDHRKFGGLAEF